MKETGRKYPFVEAAAMPASGAWAQKRRLAAAIRRIISLLVVSQAPEAELARAADGAENFADRLAEHPRTNRLWGYAESANAGDVSAFFDQSPLIGLSNPLAPPLVLRAEGEMVRGTARFGAAYEGPPGCVHGGFVAAAFDELLGFAQSLTGSPGMTGSLTVHYRRPTPLHAELVLEAGIERVEGRKIWAWGKMMAGEVLTAEANGLFISVNVEKFQDLLRTARTPD